MLPEGLDFARIVQHLCNQYREECFQEYRKREMYEFSFSQNFNGSLGDSSYVITDEHFGLNFVADYERIGTQPWAIFDEAVIDLGVNNIRYPGGINSERGFDITNPNASTIYFEDGATRQTMGAFDFGAYCSENGITSSYIIPSIQLMSENSNGELVFDPAMREYVVSFIMGILNSTEGNISSIEIGNEYETFMISQEYGGLVNELAPIIQGVIDDFKAVNQLGDDWNEPDIAVQAWTFLAQDSSSLTNADLHQRNQGVLTQLSSEALSAIDEVVTHWYGKGRSRSYIDAYLALELEIQSSLEIFSSWDDASARDLSNMVSEWNVFRGEAMIFGMAQAPFVVKMFAEFVQSGADRLDLWAAQYHATSPVLLDGSLGVSGQIFSYLSNETVGYSPLDVVVGDADIGAVAFMNDSDGVFILSNLLAEQRSIDFSFDELGDLYNIDRVGFLEVDTVQSDGSYRDWTNLESYLEPDLPATIVWETSEFSFSGIQDLTLEPYQTVFFEFSGAATSYGTAFDDTLTANATAERFDGGEGIDLVEYSSAPSGIFANLEDTEQNTGWALGDTYVGIEGIIGSSYSDIIVGDSQNNHIFGGSGNDLLYGLEGRDIIHTGAGTDTVDGGQGDDSIFLDGASGVAFGGSGDDYFEFLSGSYSIEGQGGNDVVSFKNFSSAVSIWADQGIVELGSGAQTEFSSIETLVGSDFADRFTLLFGDMAAFLENGDDNVRIGFGASVTIDTGQGDDFCFNESASSTFRTGRGNDTVFSVSGGSYHTAQGDDKIFCGHGVDELTFGFQDGNDQISNFDIFEDSIVLGQSAIAALLAGEYQISSDMIGAELSFIGGGAVYFSGLSEVDLEYIFSDYL
jgi:Ca2+-binding RTX toxin-like protein